MSLRSRLTLLYALLLGGVLLLFGTLVYALVSVILMDQVDTSLAKNATDLTGLMRVNPNNQFDPRPVSGFKPADNVVFQVWGDDRRLQLQRPFGQSTGLDETGLRSGEARFNSVTADRTHLRVLTVPLTTTRGPVGILQIGENLALVDLTQRTLLVVLILLTSLAMLMSGLATWLVNGQALAPLATVTQVAAQITRADDLSRRIPLAGTPGAEVTQLIQSFNATLARLEKLFHAQQRFLADVSHELRTPLTVIKGNVGILRRMGAADEESLGSIDSEVDRLARLVGDLLLLAQAESGRVPLALATVELDTILMEVYQQMRLLAGERVQIRIAEIDQVAVLGDRDRLKQVLLNLVGNAVQYTPAGGEVLLALRRSGERALVTVTDTGPGIPAQDLPHIFERFYRGEKSRKRSLGSGFGLGLSIAYWIVHSHGGTIEVQSKEGAGTTFSVWLPLGQPPAPAGKVVSKQPLG